MTVADKMQVEPSDVRSHGDTQMNASQKRAKKPYQAHHPHSHHHRRVKAQPKQHVVETEILVDESPLINPNDPFEQHFHRVSHQEPEIEIDQCVSPSPDTNPNDPFEKHFLAASLTSAADTKVRSSSFRNDKPKPVVIRRNTDNYSSSPNLLFAKDDLYHDNRAHEPRGDPPLRRVRSFKSTSKGGVINRGDSFRKKNSSRNIAAGSMTGHDSPRLDKAASHSEFVCTPSRDDHSSYFKVQVLGAPGCGKTSITNQFMSSDYANAYDSMNVDDIERTVTIQLDGDEQTMEFIDALPWDDRVDHDIDVTADAYVIVYSVIDRVTFDAAVQSLYKMRHGLGTDRPIVLVGNKIDLVRKRKVKRDDDDRPGVGGEHSLYLDVLSICRTYDCLHFETSAALNHHVDELLVTILKQIRHKLNPALHPSPEISEPEMKRRESGKGASGFLVRLYRRLSRKGRPKSK